MYQPRGLVRRTAAFALSMVNSFKRVISPALVLAFCAFEGVALGAISKVFEAQFEGIVIQAGRKGFRVKQITPEMISGIYQAREAVEGYAARVFAMSAGPAQLDRLAQLLNRDDGLPTVESAYQANRLVHRAVVEATGNPYLVDLFDDIWGKGIALRIYADLWVTENVHRPLADDHLVLLEALRSGDGARAEAAMVEHIHSALGLQLVALKGKPEADS